jgi:DNA-binding transcriptional ArsR family regulator
VVVYKYISYYLINLEEAMDEVEELSELFKALSDPTRLRLVQLLAEHKGSLCVNALAHKLGVSQSAVSQHLRVLRQSRLVEGERHGYHVHYALDPARLEHFRTSVLDTLGEEFVVVER